MKRLEKMTAQEIFDASVNHLRKQGCKSIVNIRNGFERCAYRGPDGKMCAAGPFIPDEMYTPEMEGLRWGQEGPEWPLTEHMSLVKELQVIHDGHHEWNWEARWQKLAVIYGLVYTAPEAK